MKRLLVCTCVAVLVYGAVVQGQSWSGGGAPYPVYYHSSTAAEGAARGMADVIRSAGDYNLRTSEAARNVEEARSRNLDNRLKSTQTFFEMRRVNREARAAETTPRLSTEAAFRLAREAAPRRLTSAQLDRLTGHIEWPLILRNSRYDALCQPLEQLFASRAAGTATADSFAQVQRAAAELQAALRKNLKEYRSGDFIEAKKFIDSLEYEARFPAGANA